MLYFFRSRSRSRNEMVRYGTERKVTFTGQERNFHYNTLNKLLIKFRPEFLQYFVDSAQDASKVLGFQCI